MTKTDPLMTQDGIRPVIRSTIVESVADQLRKQILSGGLTVGARLPPERELAARLGVNRLSLRAALARLEEQGLVTTQHGTGTMVLDWREHGGVEMLPRMVRLARDHSPTVYVQLVGELLELRRTVAAEGVALASMRRTEQDLASMREAARGQGDKISDVESFARGDIEFARNVVRAARNTGLSLCFNTISRFQHEETDLVILMYPQPALQCAHYDIVIGLIEAGDPTQAREIMRGALEAFDALVIEKLAKSTDSRGREEMR